MNYELGFHCKAEKELGNQDRPVARRILDKLDEVLLNPHRENMRLRSPLHFLYKIRIGNLRVVYGVNDMTKMVIVYAIAERSEEEAYKLAEERI